MEAPVFVNRKTEIDQIVDGDFALLNVHGETGIGKSRLLAECRKKWAGMGSAYQVLLVDLEAVCAGPGRAVEKLLRAIISQAPELFVGVWNSPEQVAGLVVSQLADRARSCPKEKSCVILIFDTAEELQKKPEDWRWLEQNLVRPLVLAGSIKLIFSGRTPIKWMDFAVRRHAVAPLRLEPLGWAPDGEAPDGGAAQELVHALIREKGHTLPAAEWQRLGGMILALSFGHPRLIEELVGAVAEDPRLLAMPDLDAQLSECVVKIFIEQHIFSEIPADWRGLLWWMSVLDSFDPIFLKIFLTLAVPEAVAGQPEAYFLKGIRLLHERSLVIWKEGQGEQFQGVVGKIIRKCFEITRRADYASANKAAADTYRALVKEYLVDEEDLIHDYQAQAAVYDGRAVMAEAA